MPKVREYCTHTRYAQIAGNTKWIKTETLDTIAGVVLTLREIDGPPYTFQLTPSAARTMIELLEKSLTDYER